jgi:hypothetical protein
MIIIMNRTVLKISVNLGAKHLLSTVALSALFLASLNAATTPLPLRYEPLGTCVYNATSSPEAIEAGFGASAHTLPINGSTSFDFYSPPIVTAPSLTTADRCSGKLWITNAGTVVFNATIQFSFFDYDPHTGVEILLGQSGVSGKTKINLRTVKKLTTPGGVVITNMMPSVGHLLHVRAAITVYGTANNASIVFNAPSGGKGDSAAYLPQQRAAKWVFAASATSPDATITAPTLVPASSMGNVASVKAISGASYTWTITGGSIMAGQGTAAITWTAEANGTAILVVEVSKECSWIGSATVPIGAIATLPSSRLLSITCVAGLPAQIMGTGGSDALYVIEASEDLVTWNELGSATADGAGVFTFNDPDWGTLPARFYRAVAQ